MNKYQLFLTKPARKQLAKLSAQNQVLIATAILKLKDNPRPYGSEKLTDLSAYRIRIGKYRVIYEINDQILTVYVLTMGHRKDIYQ
jgi:mRNA interferase RelE/StbE